FVRGARGRARRRGARRGDVHPRPAPVRARPRGRGRGHPGGGAGSGSTGKRAGGNVPSGADGKLRGASILPRRGSGGARREGCFAGGARGARGRGFTQGGGSRDGDRSHRRLTIMMVYVNGRIVPKEEATISVFDHGFLYGDGVFE